MTEPDVLEDYRLGSAWTLSKVEGALGQLDADTPCDEWDVRTLLNHMLQTQLYFVGSARGEDVAPPSGQPPELLSDDPVADFARARSEMLTTFSEEGMVEKTGPALAIAFSDALVHGWDLAEATGQDASMPDGLPEAAYSAVHGRFTDEQRKGLFKPEVAVAPTASAQDKLLAYMGRAP